MRCTFSVLTQDTPGVLMRIACLFYKRNYNIESLSVSPTNLPGIARFTVMIDGDEWAHEQVEKQLIKLVEVISVDNLNKCGKFVERWLSLIKVRATMEMRPHILQIADVFRCRVVDMGSDALTLEVTGDEGKVEACTEALRAYGILEIAGSGSVALGRAGFNTSGARCDDVADPCRLNKLEFDYMIAGTGDGVSHNVA
ncbi:MAG: acetolactate synthase small subunit [Synergistaceae bacterium]|jgi:acetolactate synthase-1/3 small subunit|nr:acetolactate synthase small subunit [Synergistaceae bacterium]